MNAKNLGLAGGVTSGLMLMMLTLIAMMTGWGKPATNLLATVYPGYSTSFIGSLVGFVYGFIDGLISFYLIGFIYNALNRTTRL